MSKRQLIEAIQQYNTTAKVTFLSQFDDASLEQYLNHLQEAARKRPNRQDWKPEPDVELRLVS